MGLVLDARRIRAGVSIAIFGFGGRVFINLCGGGYVAKGGGGGQTVCSGRDLWKVEMRWVRVGILLRIFISVLYDI